MPIALSLLSIFFHCYVDVMLHYLAEFPHAVIVPSIQSRSLQVSQLTWNLDLVPEVRELSQGKHVTEIPIVDDSAFMLRSELYHSVGGFDEFFYWPDSAGSIAFSLAVWLCGGSIAMTECAQVSGTGSQPQSGEQAIKYLQYAKYIQAVFGGSLVEYITYPGLEFYQRSQYDRHVRITAFVWPLPSRLSFYCIAVTVCFRPQKIAGKCLLRGIVSHFPGLLKSLGSI